jgi:hypothetical protein
LKTERTIHANKNKDADNNSHIHLDGVWKYAYSGEVAARACHRPIQRAYQLLIFKYLSLTNLNFQSNQRGYQILEAFSEF